MSSRCDLYVPGIVNVWVERGESPNDVHAPGVCMLDSMSDEQIINSLERDPMARADLRLITTDPHLLALADLVPPMPTVERNDVEQSAINAHHSAGSIPFYAIFRGQPPFAQ